MEAESFCINCDTLLFSVYIYIFFLFHIGVIACFVFLLSSDADGHLSAGTAGHVSKREPAKVLSSCSTTRPWGHQHCSFRSRHQNDAASVVPVSTCSTPVLLLHPSPLLTSLRHIRVNRHLPWIACVRVKAWAGHRPLPGNCSHLDSLQFISCDFFFFFYSGVIFFLFGPGMDVPEAGKHGKKSTSQKLEDQKKVGKTFLLFSFWLSLPWNLLLLSPAVCAAFPKIANFWLAFIDFIDFYRCPIVSARWFGMLRCCSPELLPFWKKKKKLLLLSVFPLAPLPHIF